MKPILRVTSAIFEVIKKCKLLNQYIEQLDTYLSHNKVSNRELYAIQDTKAKRSITEEHNDLTNDRKSLHL
jgi:hypothetical protein